MMHDEAFLQAITEDPEDDTPRLVFADWLEENGRPERAEFIRVQCLLDTLPSADDRRPPLEDLERRLLERHQDEWLGPLRPLLGRWTFRRGFLDTVAVPLRVYLEHTAIDCPPTVHRVEVDLIGAEIAPETVLLVPECLARENLIFPLASRPGRLLLAMANPHDKDTLQKMQFIFACDIEGFPAAAEQILDAIERHYGPLRQDEVTDYLSVFEVVAIHRPEEGGEPSVTILVNLIIREAIDRRATEIRIEPQVDRLVVLYRIEGKMVVRDEPPRRLLEGIVARIRMMAGLDEGDRARVQWGRIRVGIDGQLHELAATIRETAHGPSVVMTVESLRSSSG